MRFSVALPNGTEGLAYPCPFAGPDDILKLARLIETLPYHGVWCNDHLSTQRYVKEAWAQPPNYYDPLISLAAVGAETTRLRLGTSILVLPFRDPVVVAKQVATLDRFTQGRFTLGVGVGAYREEFEAVRPRLKNENRGAILEESVLALRSLFEEPRSTFRGRHVDFEGVEMHPKPTQEPLPIYFAGNSVKAVDRAARWGQGWFPAVMPHEEMTRRIARLREGLEAAGRPPEAVEIAPQVTVSLGKTATEARLRFERSQMYRHLESLKASTLKGQDIDAALQHDLVGTPDEVLDKVGALDAIGVRHLASLAFVANSLPEVEEQIQWFAQEVIVPFRRAVEAS